MIRWLWLMIIIMLVPAAEAHAHGHDGVRITVSASPESASISSLDIRPLPKWGREVVRANRAQSAGEAEWPRATITIGGRTYIWDWQGRLWDGTAEVQLSESARNELERHVTITERAHFGAPRDWQEMRKIFRRMTYARVTDLETGLTFRVQRRAGSRHADVQPVTREDTAIMKQIYQGKWSWKRRAILIHIDGHTYAASMNGMPHGRGAIRGNNFRGHFCIHFPGSSTHLSRRPDPAHRLMIDKASGTLWQVLRDAAPADVAERFLIALHERDSTTVALTAEAAVPSRLPDLEYVRQKGPFRQIPALDPFTATLSVPVSVVERNRSKRNETWLFTLKRTTPSGRWKIIDVARSDPVTEKKDREA